ncbi:MAG: extracellular solute-binding protein [Alphaproteobacteria bacterium]|nr:extracellular solute-binding protein [Alphaproteobacteria bacterium]
MSKPITMIDRRTILKGGAALGLGAVVAPAIVSKSALASSGEVNFVGWAGYDDLKAKVFPAFEKATGIKVNFTEYPSQDDMFAQAKLAMQTGAIDVAEPTVDRVAGWASNGLVQGWDQKKISLDAYLPGLADGAAGEAATIGGQRMIVPSVWGTEAITYNTKDVQPTGGIPSLGDLFDPKYKGKVCVRAHSSLAAMGRYLDATGKLPMPWLESYKNEANMRKLWDIAFAEAVKVKSNIAQFWSGENDAQAGFRTNGAVIGLTWDSTGFNLRKEGYKYIAPKEGAFAWNQGFVLLKNAKNVEQSHAFAKWVSSAEGAAAWATAFSANPVGKGSVEKLDKDVADFYSASFPGDALKKLWWWPTQEAWFVKIRGEYADKWKAA